MRGWWRDLADLVLPADCGGCGVPRTLLCDTCRASLYGRAPRRVQPDPAPAGLPMVHAAAPYEDAVRAVLLAHKERGALGLAEALGVALAGAVRAGLQDGMGSDESGEHNAIEGGDRGFDEGRDEGARGLGGGLPEDGARETRWGREAGGAAQEPTGPLLLVPMPSARRAVAARGHDSVRRIALSAARDLRCTGSRAQVLPVLRQRRRVVDQSGLNSRQRMANMGGALEVVPGAERLLLGHRIVLVDDLMTTGASLAEAARALRAAVTEVRVSGTQVLIAGSEAGSRVATPAGTVGGSTPGTRPGASRTVEQRGMFPSSAAVVATSPDSFGINRN